MKGNIPVAGDDFIAMSNGFKFGIGINNPTGDEDILCLSIEKAKGGGLPNVSETWQFHLQDNDPVFKCAQKFKSDMLAYYIDFLNRCNVILKSVTGAGIPGYPQNDFTEQLKWLIKNGTKFDGNNLSASK